MATSQIQIIMPSHVNSSNRLFGGQLMAWIDLVAGVAAMRHTHKAVTTAAVDNLTFLSPAHLGDILRLDAQITWTGKTSLEVRVDSYVERLGGGEKWINRAYLVFVALNPDGSSAPVVPFVPRTEAEKSEWAQAERRRQIRLETRRD